DASGQPAENIGIAIVSTSEPVPDGLWWGAPSLASHVSSRNTDDGCYAHLRLAGPFPVYVSAVLTDAVLATQTVPAPVDELVFRIDCAALDARTGGVRVRFVDAVDGKPIPHGLARLRSQPEATRAGPEVDARGEVVFGDEQPGAHWLGFYDEKYA